MIDLATWIRHDIHVSYAILQLPGDMPPDTPITIYIMGPTSRICLGPLQTSCEPDYGFWSL